MTTFNYRVIAMCQLYQDAKKWFSKSENIEMLFAWSVVILASMLAVIVVLGITGHILNVKEV